ncbi:YggS family pyridoxal phosphate-dependent enzyme [Singulisphaera acidiphila]|nr:YggS family pyridoxal phosphate-dependent enzyme [Singulisphaera acidiphila]
MDTDVLRRNLDSVRHRIAEAAQRSGRSPDEVTLVVVTKRLPVEVVPPLVALGALDLGENYPQELWEKVNHLGNSSVRWHLIGHLQSNKAKKTVPMVRMIHAVDSLRLLQGLDALVADPENGPAVCLQVNTSNEPAKHGWSVDEILADADAIAGCRNLRVAGLMTMAALDTTSETARPSFILLRDVREKLKERTGLRLEQLSMGMSNDFETAIEEGATIVRVGSAIFEGVFS